MQDMRIIEIVLAFWPLGLLLAVALLFIWFGRGKRLVGKDGGKTSLRAEKEHTLQVWHSNISGGKHD